MLLNFKKDGISWKKHQVHAQQVKNRNCPVIEAGSPELGELAEKMIQTAIEQGILPDKGDIS